MRIAQPRSAAQLASPDSSPDSSPDASLAPSTLPLGCAVAGNSASIHACPRHHPPSAFAMSAVGRFSDGTGRPAVVRETGSPLEGGTGRSATVRYASPRPHSYSTSRARSLPRSPRRNAMVLAPDASLPGHHRGHSMATTTSTSFVPPPGWARPLPLQSDGTLEVWCDICQSHRPGIQMGDEERGYYPICGQCLHEAVKLRIEAEPLATVRQHRTQGSASSHHFPGGGWRVSSGSNTSFSPASNSVDLPTPDERPLPPIPDVSARTQAASAVPHSNQPIRPPSTRPPRLRLPELDPDMEPAREIPPALPSPEPRGASSRPAARPPSHVEAPSAPSAGALTATLMESRSRSSPEHPTVVVDATVDVRRARMSWTHLDAPSFTEDNVPNGPPPSYHEAIRASTEREGATARRDALPSQRAPLDSSGVVHQATVLSQTVQRLASLSTSTEDSQRASRTEQAPSTTASRSPSVSGAPASRSSLSFTPLRAESVPGAFSPPVEPSTRPPSSTAQEADNSGLPPVPPMVNVIDRYQRRTSALADQEQVALMMAVESNVFRTRLWAADTDKIKSQCLNWETCPGCLEPIARGPEASAPLPNDRTGTREVTISPCRHGAHTRCLISWMAQGYGTCPQCRQTWVVPAAHGRQ